MKKKFLIVAILAAVTALVLFGIFYGVYKNKLSGTDHFTKNREAFINNSQGGMSQNDRGKTFDKLVALGADGATMQYVPDSSEYVRDARTVYWIFPQWEPGAQRKVEGADPDSFAVLSGSGRMIARDRAHVYITGDPIEGADPKTFAGVGHSAYYHDSQSVFYKEEVNTRSDYRYRLRVIPGADPKTIRPLTDDVRYRSSQAGITIVIDDSFIYLRGEPVPGLDAKTFQLVAGGPYFSDRYATYFFNGEKGASIIPLAPTSTIRIFTNDSVGGGYVAIGNKMFMGTTTIDSADPSSFKIFDAEMQSGEKVRGDCGGNTACPYAADNHFVYYYGKKIPGADPHTFMPIGYGLLHNKGKDPGSAQPRYARDRSRVYYLGTIVDGADPDTFIPILSGEYYSEYGRDAQAVYWQSKIIFGADPNTFYAFDGQQPYEGCGAGRYSADATFAYYQNRRISDVDLKTFKVVIGAGDYAEDALQFYRGGSSANRKEYKECDYGG